MTRGLYIVIEGPSFSGKTTHLIELAERLETAGIPVRTFEDKGHAARLATGLQRQEDYFLKPIAACIESGVTCIADHNYLTPLVHHYYGHGTTKDYDALANALVPAGSAPQPDVCIVLDAPVSTLLERAHKYHGNERQDNLEPAFLERVRAGYLWEAKERGYTVAFTTEKTASVSETIWQQVSPLLTRIQAIETAQPEPVSNILQSRYGSPGQLLPKDGVTDMAASIYSLSSRLSVDETGKVLELFSQSSQNLRADILPAVLSNSNPGETKPNLQLSYIVIEGLSDLLARHIARCGQEQFYEQPLSGGSIQYYTPENLDEGTKKLYDDAMRYFLAMHTSFYEDLSAYLRKEHRDYTDGKINNFVRRAISGLLPVATKTNICIGAPMTSLYEIASALSSLEFTEAHTAGQAMLQQLHVLRQPTPTKAAEPKKNKEPRISSLRQLAEQFLPTNHTAEASPVKLLAGLPRNEQAIIPPMLYAFTDQPLQTIQQETESWSYGTKSDIMRSYLAQPERDALDYLHYSWEILSDYKLFRELGQRQYMTGIHWQPLTPRHGYDIPSLIEEAGLLDEYEQCFERSLALYSHMQRAGYILESQYATLFGHRVRWQFTQTGREMAAFYQHFHKKGIAKHMHAHINAIHPIIGEFLANSN